MSVFSCIYTSQGSAVTQLRCGEMSSNHFIDNFPKSVRVKNYENRLIFFKVMDNNKVGRF